MPAARPQRSRSITGIGYGFVIASAALLLAAFTTGGNLYYLLFAALASVTAVSFAISRRSLSRLEPHREAPASVYREEPCLLSVHIHSRRRRTTAYGLRIEQRIGGRMSSGFVPQVKPGGLSVARVTERFAQRGVYPLPSFRLVTSFPFGLLETAASYDDRREIVVYPRVHAVRAAPVTRAASYHARPPARRGEGDEFFSLREYVPGDEVRHIAWKASARASKLLVKELELQTERSVLISFDTRQAPGDDDTGERFEEAVELVASLAVSMLNSEYEVAVATPETLVPMGKGQAHSTNVLEMLARAQPLALGMHGPEGRAADATAALALYVSARPRNWGAALPGGARFLDPREVIHA